MNKPARLLMLATLVVPFLGLRAQQVVTDTPQTQTARLALLVDPRGDLDRDPVFGFQIGYAQKIYPIDQMVISYGHSSSSDFEQNFFLLSFEEHYPLLPGFAAYGQSGLGFLWTDDKVGDADREALFGQLGLGVIYQPPSRWAFFGEVNYSIATKSVWLDGQDLENRNLQFLLGVRYWW